MKFSNLRIATRLNTGFAVVLALSVMLAAVARVQLQKVDDMVTEINDSWTLSIIDLNEMRGVMESVRRIDLSYLLVTTDAERDAYDQKREEAWKLIDAPEARYEKTGISSPAEQALYDDFKNKLGVYRAHWPRLRELARAGEGKSAEARAYALGENFSVFSAAKKQLMTDIDLNTVGADAMKTKSAATVSQSETLLGVALVAALAFGGGFAFWLGRSITAPLERAMAWAHTIASGDLSTSVGDRTEDETGRLLTGLGAMQETLRGMILGIRGSADQVSTASSQIATGNNDLSLRTEQQAASLQETAASVEQLSSAVVSSETSAREARSLATAAMQIATAGGTAVGRVSGTMRQISNSSKKIADIIGVIDSIAFQTNILALNAAVEAARAGEQGRGFAVVASEVRVLAQRSAQAAREIKTLIQESVERVGEGDALVTQASTTMTQIVEAVQKVTLRIAEISASATEQSAGIQQVNSAVSSLDRATQQNAALVEESAAAAESLQVQAGQLAGSVAKFRLQAA